MAPHEEAGTQAPAASEATAQGPAAWTRFLYLRRYEISALLVAAVSAGAALAVESRWVHPSGGDPGQWLTLTNTIMGRGISDLSPYQYPPYFFLLLALFILILGAPVVALYAALGLILVTLSISAFYAFRTITGNPFAALLFCMAVSFSWTVFEMVAWGGYPNLSSFTFYLFALAFLWRTSIAEATPKHFIALGAATGMVFVSHPLSTAMLAMASTSFFLLVVRRATFLPWVKRLLLFSAPVWALLYVPFFILQQVNAVSAPQYITHQDVYTLGAAFHPLLPPFLRPLFPYEDLFVASASALVSVLALLPIALHRLRGSPGPRIRTLLGPWAQGEAGQRAYAMFVSTLIPALMFPVALWSAGLNSDYSRALYFALFPLAAGFACVLSRLRDDGPRAAMGAALGRMLRRTPAGEAPTRRVGHTLRFIPFKTPGRAAAMAFTALLMGAMAVDGVAYLSKSSDYYIDFEDSNDQQLVHWIVNNTAPDSRLMVSQGVSSKWAGGLTGRPVEGYQEPLYLFYERELERNFQIYQMFTNRIALDQQGLELSTQGGAASGGFQLRASVLAKNGAYGLFDLRDATTALETSDGTRYYFNDTQLAQPLEVSTRPDGTAWFATTSMQNETGAQLRREALLEAGVGVVRFSVRPGTSAAVTLVMQAPPVAFPCDIASMPGGVIWKVYTRNECATATLRGPTLDLQHQTPELRFDLSNGLDFSMLVEAPLSSSGFETLPAFSDSYDLFRHSGVDYLVLDKAASPSWIWMIREYSFAAVYENAKYLVIQNSLL